MKDILLDIIANKRIEVARQEEAIPLHTLISMGGTRMEMATRSMRASLANSDSGIIAEFKRKSPSKGWLHPGANVREVLPAYEKGGASACSVLTDSLFFGGSLGDLSNARKVINLPLLRKDFIISSYQLYQARVMGADAVLLIAACLTPGECLSLAETAHALSMEVLLEIHSESELNYLNPYVDMVGVNNRNLGSFHTDVENSVHLAGKLPKEILKISESGISDPLLIAHLRAIGYRGFLIGETFMKEKNPGDALTSFKEAIPC